MSLTRKEFLSSVVSMMAGAAGAALLVGCSSDNGSADAASSGNCTANGTVPTIGANHGHTLTVTKDEVVAGSEKTYDIKGTSVHTHTVTITAAMFTMLNNNTAAMTTSTTDSGHAHSIMLACA